MSPFEERREATIGRIDNNFKPLVPVFDANVALGRRHNRRVTADSAHDTLAAMDQAGVSRALVYAPHAATFDARDGNRILMETVRGEPRLVPQYVCTPTFDDPDSFAAGVLGTRMRSIRMFPISHRYPFRDWVVKSWLNWLADQNVLLWLPATEFDPAELHDTLKEHPGVTVVLCEVHYSHVPWALPLLRTLPNLCIEISRFVIGDGIPRLQDTVGHERILYGSWFPDSPMAPQLYNLHHCGLSEEVLSAICAGNLSRLLGG